MKPWDVSVSHASEDKVTFVDPLARRLRQLAVRVWYDRFILAPGDRLSEKIAEGIAQSRCGRLISRRAFIGKHGYKLAEKWNISEANQEPVMHFSRMRRTT